MNVIRSKFRGCLVGAWGDALGQIFECQYWNEPVPKERFEELSNDRLHKIKQSGKQLAYTDDTAMTKAICRSLLSNQSFNVKDMAKEFAVEYFREPLRGYGAGVVTVFGRLRSKEHDDDIFLPAREQFGGTGSYGNGAAMRVSPLSLFYRNNLEQLKIASKRSALITHAHILAVNGAILQAVAVHESLNTSVGNLDAKEFLEKLIETAQGLEGGTAQGLEGGTEQCLSDDQKETTINVGDTRERVSYVVQFEHIKRMLFTNNDKPDLHEVISTLGHGVEAVEAVPAALFSFLFNLDGSFKDAILYAISLGGDTDTIASMTGAIAGAYWGEEVIPKEWLEVAESVNEVTQFADDLHDLQSNKAVT